MSNDIDCPYCGMGQEINRDDGYGYEDGETIDKKLFEQECYACDKIFVYTAEISFYYEAKKAPCKNGDGDHEWKDRTGYPEPAFRGKQCCAVCDERRDTMPPEERRKIMDKFFEELKA